MAAVSPGYAHTCALTTLGGAKCWGANDSGQVGDGTATQRTTPVEVPGLTSGVAIVAAGGNHTCGLTTAGGLKCWGNNGGGELGDGTTTDRWTPADVTGFANNNSAVGGIAELPDVSGSSRPNETALAGFAAAALLALTAGAWYARRRWGR